MQTAKMTLYYDSQDPYARYGFQHFLFKYGFSSTVDPLRADIFCGYSLEGNSHAQVQIIMNPVAEDGVCFLKILEEAVPVFKIPIQAGGSHFGDGIIQEGDGCSCFSLNNNRISIGFDIFAEIGKTLAGLYDENFLKKDRVGKTLRFIPVVDVMEEALFSYINMAVPAHGLRPRQVWPDGHKFCLIITHDVDRVYKTYHYIPSIIRAIKKARMKELKYHISNMLFRHGTHNPYWAFEYVPELEKSLGVKSTYYFLNEKGRPNPFSFKTWPLYLGRYKIENSAVKRAIRKLADLDCEIGVHGSYQSYLSQELLQKEKIQLESIVGSSISGIRQHYLNYHKSITPLIHGACGFNYDTSIGYKPDDGIGFRRGTSFPFQIILPGGETSPVLEIPLIIMETGLESSSDGLKESFALMDKVERYGGVLNILWHSSSLNKDEFPVYFEIFNRIIREAQARGAWVARASDVYQRVVELSIDKVNEELTV